MNNQLIERTQSALTKAATEIKTLAADREKVAAEADRAKRATKLAAHELVHLQDEVEKLRKEKVANELAMKMKSKGLIGEDDVADKVAEILEKDPQEVETLKAALELLRPSSDLMVLGSTRSVAEGGEARNSKEALQMFYDRVVTT